MRLGLTVNIYRWAWVACLVMFSSAAGAADVQGGLAEFAQGRFAEAFEEWQADAATGDATGALYVGVLYDSGLGIAQSYRGAMTWYQRAADFGSAAGAFNVGILHDAGLGTPADPEAAAVWYSRAAAKGYPRAEYNLALLYESGSGVPRDRARAMGLFRRAAAHGITAARAHLAALGEVVPYATIVSLGDGMQAFQQAQRVLLTRGPAEASRVAALFRVAAEHHNPLAEYDYGYCLEHGLGVAADLAQALVWYQRAAAEANDDGLRNIAKASVINLEETTTPRQPAPDKPANNRPVAAPLTTANDRHAS